MTSKRPAVFLDRDGTINVDVDFLTRREDLRLIDGSAKALRSLAEAGFLLLVVTNQSGVARGYLSEEELCQLHEALDEVLDAKGVRVTDYYYCPHHPSAGDDDLYTGPCRCRKPLPGLFLDAAADYDVDIGRSFAVGDAVRDLQAAEAAGLRTVWVRTGRTKEEELDSAEPPVQPMAREDDLANAARWILEQASPGSARR